MYKPASTYRIQFNKDFNFKKLKSIIPYLKNLGVDTIYASPIFAAIPGSTHGYDIVNPLMINPEIGTEAELIEISGLLNNASIGWLQDIVPNHMAFHPDNTWLMDVLKKGEKSKYATYFDLSFDGKLMVPFLDGSLEDSLKEDKITVVEYKNEYFLNDGNQNWPINRQGSAKISGKKLSAINKDKNLLKEIIGKQFYRLCDWQETNERINYRRFFTVNALICLNIQDKQVFEAYHQYIFKLVKIGVFNGLRIDHIDGLYDPQNYLSQLRSTLGDDVYLVVEKILAKNETLGQDWKCDGTTGYDFMALSNNLFTNTKAKEIFDKVYGSVTGKQLSPRDMVIEKKRCILKEYMQGELNNLFDFFLRLNLSRGESFDPSVLKASIGEMLIAMPVYRYYEYDFPAEPEVAANIGHLLKPLLKDKTLAAGGQLLQKIFLKNTLEDDAVYNKKVSGFYQRCMQFSGPLMAKGVEDTLMFTFNRFTGHNEVGDAPEAFGLQVKDFHKKMIGRQEKNPFTMNASATHDTKKGEDVRARLNVLTDVPKQWAKFINKISRAITKQTNPDFSSIHPNDLYFILQHIVGILPFAGQSDQDLNLRLDAFIEKALREAKKRSDWAVPDTSYEQVLKDFIKVCLNNGEIIGSLIQEWVYKIADSAVLNSLSQLILKFTAPGIPDVYQGTELWDLSLVDPDNRRPVDYSLRNQILAGIAHQVDTAKLWRERYDGKIKLYLTSVLLKLRKSHQILFEQGSYVPLKVKGKYADRIVAFARNLNDQWIIVALPLGIEGFKSKDLKIDWEDTQIHFPKQAPSGITDLISGKAIYKDILKDGILIKQIFHELNVAVLQLSENPSGRSAGLLMHISSLPSAFGIGDMGKEAYQFIDFLSKSKQRYWQILPLNPTKAENGHSPYSSNSAHAGNPLLISLESLSELGLLSRKELENFMIPDGERINFKLVSSAKRKGLDAAYQKFLSLKEHALWKDFYAFMELEENWLDAFALYTAIKAHHQQAEWYNWPDEFKYRNKKSLEDFQKENQDELLAIKWQQFIFYKQWLKLKALANQNHIKIIGDLPFYLDYDSVEVWSQPEYFKLKDDLSLNKVAGVPPDYFNEKGQLWGMPIFNWAKHRDNDYKWWIERLKWNAKCFDVIRLDHFLAFSKYWQVDAAAVDARSGEWIQGPGEAFFRIIKESLGALPFIAEDLGERSAASEELRSKLQLPGMAVLQFGFGEDLVGSLHVPFNIDSNTVVYSGTHDNNTILGWYMEDIQQGEKKRLSRFTSMKINTKNINEIITRLAYASQGKLVILPVQDVLNFDGAARMNIPGTAEGNWTWRLTPNQITKKTAQKLAQMVRLYGRSY